MSERTGKWSTQKKMMLSVGILIAFAVGFIGLYFMMENQEVHQQKVEVVSDTPTAEERARALLAELYVDEEKSELNENVDASVYDGIMVNAEAIEDEELKNEIIMESAESIGFLYTQMHIRNALEDEEILNRMTVDEIYGIEESLKYAEERNLNFVKKIMPEFDELKKRFESREDMSN